MHKDFACQFSMIVQDGTRMGQPFGFNFHYFNLRLILWFSRAGKFEF